MSNTGLSGHKFKIYKPQVYLDIRKLFLFIRVINEWNSLPVPTSGSLIYSQCCFKELYWCLNCNTVESFKKRIDCYFRGIGDIHKLALSFFHRDSHLRVASWVQLNENEWTNVFLISSYVLCGQTRDLRIGWMYWLLVHWTYFPLMSTLPHSNGP